MLLYLGHGERRYGEATKRVYRRTGWEIEAVIEGVCAPILLEGALPLAGRRLWVFPPEIFHGWTGEKGEACSVTVFHFDRLPELLEEIARSNHPFSIDIDDEFAHFLVETAEALRTHIDNPGLLTPLTFEIAMGRISLRILEQINQRELGKYADRDRYIVSSACAWFSEHMAKNPCIDEIAAAANWSVSHLRRLFHKVHHVSPQQHFREMQTGRARELLSYTELSIKEIGRSCGFSSDSVFSRSFKQFTGMSPKTWKEQNTGPRLNVIPPPEIEGEDPVYYG